jgi:MoaA/NifB/PqqE/SkfB family radical SAM enzyme
VPFPADRSLDELRIELLQKCTLACVHCSAESSPAATRSLDYELVIRILREAKVLGLKSVVFTGGEPLIELNLVRYVSEAHKLNVRSTIFTAGFLQEQACAKKIAELAQTGLQQVNVSLYSIDPDVNASITRKLDSLRLSQNVLRAAVHNRLIAEIHFVPMSPNIEHLEGVAAWAEDNGVSTLSILKYVPQGRGRIARDTLAPAPTDEHRLRERIEKAIVKHPKLKIHVGPSLGFLGLSQPSPCESGFSTLSIRSDGLVFPCDAFKGIADAQFLKNSSTRLDITNHPLSDVWRSCPYLCATRKFINEHTAPGTIRCADGCVSQLIYQKAV